MEKEVKGLKNSKKAKLSKNVKLFLEYLRKSGMEGTKWLAVSESET